MNELQQLQAHYKGNIGELTISEVTSMCKQLNLDLKQVLKQYKL